MTEDKNNEPTEKAKNPFAEREEEILDFWRRERIFARSLEARQGNESYIFYDGPPFATGTPHYGHILASAIKDAVPRYQTMRGRYVPRRWGWDCHGLPIENIVERDLKIAGKKEIEAYGIAKFNRYARSQVLEFVGEWKKTVERMARWVDFDGSYKTMDNTYIESIWWALGVFYDQNLIYEGTRVLPYCPRCETPVAQSEIAMDNSYKDISDLSVYVTFPLDKGVNLLAWTTTPWTLPGNTGLAINPNLSYVEVKYSTPESVQHLILSKDRLSILGPEQGGLSGKDSWERLTEVPVEQLLGQTYRPPFTYFADVDLDHKENIWKIQAASYVSAEEGTGIVHLAPAFGVEDMELAVREKIPAIWHVDRTGRFTKEVTDWAGELVKPKDNHQQADIAIIKQLAATGRLFKKEKIIHSYPHCFRCETPLYYYAIPAWFVKIEALKPRLAELNEQITWIPAHLKHGRFLKSLEAAPDWNISRNRYWASPLPIWKCGECQTTRFVRSAAEFAEQVTGRNTFLFLRHGEAEKDLRQVLDKDDSGSLTERGREQIRAIATTLKERGITKIIASPVVRTHETATIVGHALGVPVETDDRLREMDFGAFRGQPVSEWKAAMVSAEDRWTIGAPDGETWSQVQARMVDTLTELNSRNQGETILIVSHGDPLYVLFLRLAGITELVGPASSVPYPSEAKVRENFKVTLFDLHRPYIDEISLACSCGGTMQRISEVIDCWFESASMPFAANHYPLENEARFKENFPADFVAEYIAQTRTWFYYMHVISTILFDAAPFRNVVTTGTILAEDGQKMSKSKGNFPDPWVIFNRYGVDALRFYLLSSPLLKAQDLNFAESEVEAVYKKHILRLQNVLAFYQLYPIDESVVQLKSSDILDRWVIARLTEVMATVTESMEQNEIDCAVRTIGDFIDDLSVWYVRRSRERVKSDDSRVGQVARATLKRVLRELAKVVAPFIPFSAEMLYQVVREGTDVPSVHLEDWPQLPPTDHQLIEQMASVRQLAEAGHADRNSYGLKLRQPLAKVTLTGVAKLSDELALVLADELNVKQIAYAPGETQSVKIDPTLTPELKREGLERELVRQIQNLRKESHLTVGRVATISWLTTDTNLQIILKDPKFTGRLKATTLIQATSDLASGQAVQFDHGTVTFQLTPKS